MASLQAKFDRFTLHNVLRYLAKSSATGRLTVQSNNGHETQVYLERGKVVHHDMPEAGVAGMTELLTWQKGAFYFEEGKSAPKKTLRLFLDNVLSEEITPDSNNADVSTLGVILRPSTVLTAEGNMELATGTIALDVFAIELLMHFDGQRTLREVAEVVSKPLEQVISASRLLLAKGIAQPLDEATPKPHQHTSSPEQSPTRQPPTEQQTADSHPANSRPADQNTTEPQTNPRTSSPTSSPSNQPPADAPRPPTHREGPNPPASRSRPAQNPTADSNSSGGDPSSGDLADFARGLTQGDVTSSQSAANTANNAANNYINPAFLDDFTQLAQGRLGPVAAMLIEDVLMDAGTSPTTLTANHIEQLVDEVEANITRQDWQEEFRNDVSALRANYGV